MATYAKIQDWVRSHYGFQPKTCWIAHCKEIFGLEVHKAPNRQGVARVHPCPVDKQSAIQAAFRHFGLIS